MVYSRYFARDATDSDELARRCSLILRDRGAAALAEGDAGATMLSEAPTRRFAAEIAPEDSDDDRPQIAPGEWLGSCHIERLIGQGGTGSVYLAYCPTLDRRVAVKVLDRRLAQDPRWRARFAREAQIAAGLIHANLVRTYDLHRDGPFIFLMMEALEGGTLAEQLDRRRRLSVEEALRTLRQAAAGLQALHRAGVVHRDIKPSNLMRDHDGVLVITDLGMARAADDQPSRRRKRITRRGQVVGTPGYMSPEQTAGDPLDGRSDLFALGVCGYEMLIGFNPFETGSLNETLLAQVYDDPLPVSERRAVVPLELSALIDRLLAKERDDRPTDAGEVIEALDAIGAQLKRDARWREATGPLRKLAAGRPRTRGDRPRSRAAEVVRSAVEASEAHQLGPALLWLAIGLWLLALVALMAG